MRSTYNRRTATKVKNGRVQHKNRLLPTGALGCTYGRERPGRGFHHVVSKRDLQAFIDIIPEWHQFSRRLEHVVLASPNDQDDGQYAFYHREKTGGIFLHAWPDDLWTELSPAYFEAHRGILERLGVSVERLRDGVLCRFTETQARAFTLLHVFMHELGHHHDRIIRKGGSTHGEDYAERFANNQFNQLFPTYVRVFGDPRKEVR